MFLDASLRRSNLVRHVLSASLVVLAGALPGFWPQGASADVPESYLATWKALRPKLDENIERYRKGNATVEIVDANGQPVTGVSVDIRQKTHDFSFGCNILPLGQLGELNEPYEQAFVNLFNLATTTFCLGAIEPVEGQVRFAEDSEEIWRRPPPDRVLAFCKKHGIKMKGQPLLADSWHPTWAKEMTADQARELYRDYFKRVAERYGNEVFRHSRSTCLRTAQSPAGLNCSEQRRDVPLVPLLACQAVPSLTKPLGDT